MSGFKWRKTLIPDLKSCARSDTQPLTLTPPGTLSLYHFVVWGGSFDGVKLRGVFYNGGYIKADS